MKVLLLALTLVSTYAFAENGENFDKLKSMVSGNIDGRISALQTFKSCVQSASNKDALKACRQSHKESMKKMHESNKAEREAFKDERKSMREERKAKKQKS